MTQGGAHSTREPDAFSTLGLPRRFDLSPADVQRAYLTRVAQMHPDAIGSELLEDLGDAASTTADLNRAKAILESDETRANLLLTLSGGPSKESDKSLPDGFLVEVMEVREQVEEALAAPTSHGPAQSADRAKWKQWALAQRADYAKAASDLFRRLDAASPPDRDRLARDLRRHLNAWRYIERMIEQLEDSYDPAKADWKAGEP